MATFVLKRCTSCGEDKPLNEFRKQSKNKDGLKYTCIPCDDKRAKERYSAKKQDIISKVRAWQVKNREKVKGYKQNYAESNPPPH